MKRDEKGFTIIELIVSVAVVALITLGGGMTTAQIIRGAQHNEDWMTAVRQINNVGYWISQDMLMTQTIDTGDDPETADVEFITVPWKDWETGEAHDVRYVWLDSADSLKKLQRKHLTYDRDGVETANKSTLVADNIDSANFSLQNGTWRLNITARSGQISATRAYEIGQRR